MDMCSMRDWVDLLPGVLSEVGGANDSLKLAFVRTWREIMADPEKGAEVSATVGYTYDHWLESYDRGMDDPLKETDLIPELSEMKAVHRDDPKDTLFQLAIDLTKSGGFSSELIRAIRTILYGLKKWKHDDCSSRTSRESLSRMRWLHNQSSLRDLQLACLLEQGGAFLKTKAVVYVARYILTDVLRDFQEELLEALPKPGPGAVAEGYTPLQKWGRIHECRSWYFHSLFGLRDAEGHPEVFDGASRETLATARLQVVPKDLWKDRVITVEPNVNGMAQQMCRSAILSCMRKHPLTKHLRPDYQKGQQEAALLGSEGDHLFDGESTLDFEDASDRITVELVQNLFPRNVTDALFACRSYYVEVPDKRRKTAVPMISYSGMGNATCFCVETLTFWAVTYAKMILWRSGSVPADEILGLALKAVKASRKIKVYGDDVIVPNDLANYSNLIETYQDLGWKLNMRKSFYRLGGQFRESCGVHAYRGEDVTCIYIDGYDVKDLQGAVAMADKIRQFDRRGFPLFARRLLKLSMLPNTHVPGIPSGVSGTDVLMGTKTLVFHDAPELEPFQLRWNHELCRLEAFAETLVPNKETTKRAFRELLLAAYCGFHYSCWITRRRRAKPGSGTKYQNVRVLSYSAACPRDVTSCQSWIPTSSWGLDLQVDPFVRGEARLPLY